MFTKKCLMSLVIYLICFNNAYSIVWFDNGSYNQVNYSITDETQIWNNGTNSTTVNLQTGSNLSTVRVFQTSNLNIYGGSVSSLYGRDYSNININGGSLNYFALYESSVLKMSSGVFSYGMEQMNKTSSMIMDGGTIHGQIDMYDYSNILMRGGSINSGLNISDFSVAEIRGGNIGGINIYDNGTFIVCGSHFRIDNAYVENGIFTIKNYSPYSTHSITGKLLNGDYISTTFSFLGYSNAKLILIPEPCTAFVFGSGFLYLLKRNRD